MSFIKSGWFAAVMGVIAFVSTTLLVFNPKRLINEKTIDEKLKKYAEAASHASTNAAAKTNSVIEHVAITPKSEVESKSSDKTQKGFSEAISSPGEPGSLRFDNKDVKEFVEFLNKRGATLSKKEKDLRDFYEQMALQFQEFNRLTQTLSQAEREFRSAVTNHYSTVSADDEGKSKRLAERLVLMMTNPPATAGILLKGLPTDDVAKAIRHLTPENQNKVFGTLDPDLAKKIYEAAAKFPPIPQPKTPEQK
ncbi:MAG: hypothetical protein EXS24_03860 [Pedosphaera sp.]|nr:hypothetical protein [Pedosphaera sp.]